MARAYNPEKYTCEKCQHRIARNQKQRHLRTCNARETVELPIESSETISEVLRRCGIAPEDVGWDLEELDKLPNLRSHPPRPARYHTPWEFFPNTQKEGLPSLETFLLRFAVFTQKKKSSKDTADMAVWDGNNPVKFTNQQLMTWTEQVLEGCAVTTRVINIPAQHCVAQPDEYASFSSDLMGKVYQVSDNRAIERAPPVALITPRLTKTDVHHDEFPGVALAIGPKAKNKEVPLKLWMAWPSTELHHLAKCYSDTNTALRCMNHGSFFVQMSGNTFSVPGNSPHAVLALESTYVYGHSFRMPSQAYDPPCIQVEIRAGLDDQDAHATFITQITRGLAGSAFHQAHIDSFIESWAIAGPIVRQPQNVIFFEEIVKLWSTCIDNQGSCPWCIATGLAGNERMHLEGVQHARRHLQA